MGKKCVKCGVRLGRKSLYCDKCGAIQPGDYKTVATTSVKRKYHFGAMIFTLLPIALVTAYVIYLLATRGINFGRFVYDEIPTDLFDFFDALAGRKSEYEIVVSQLRSNALWVALAGVVIGGALILCLGKNTENLGSALLCGVMEIAQAMIFLVLLFLVSFNDSPRIVVLVLFFLIMVASLVLFGFMAMRLGWVALPILIVSAAIGFLLGALLAPLLGTFLAFFNELFWIVAFMLFASTSGTTGIIYVRIIMY